MPLLEFQALDDYVLLHKSDDPSRWLAQGFSPIDPNFVAFHLALAAERVDRCELERLLFELTLEPVPRTLDLLDLEDRLANAVSLPWYVLLRRPLARVASPYELPKLPEPAGPPRLDTEHYLVVEARDERGKPVRGVQLELVIAGGEVKRALTDQDGTARVERIQAGRVVIRVLALDGSMWRPLEGEPSRPSSAEAGVRWHEVKQGECLSKIAHRHGLNGWKALWAHPKNEPLRKKRESPHVLLPGDQVAIPGVAVHEIVRATDAAHRIELKPGAKRRVRVRFQNLAGAPITDLPYHYVVGGEAELPGAAPTDSEGWLEEVVPLSADRFEVQLQERSLTLSMKLGTLDPVRDKDTNEPIVSGVHARLVALGYDAGAPTAEPTPQVKEALGIFQAVAMKRDDSSGELDRQTVIELARAAIV